MNYQHMQQERLKLKELANEQAKYFFTEYMVKNGLGKNQVAEAVNRAVRDMKAKGEEEAKIAKEAKDSKLIKAIKKDSALIKAAKAAKTLLNERPYND